ncbi:RHS repeat domain-containing protein [Niastella sp. OAS944]|uniref:RHS repeat domain-containing protein n=1 Tax=Niastella sp. OAS944 TaxID=2664089 RepID=UPI0035C7AFE4
MVLTEEQKQDKYPAATLEGDLANSASAVFTEKDFYDIKSDYIVNKSSVTGLTDYHNNNGNPPYNNNQYSDTAANSAKLYKLNAESNKTGLGITLKVMAGDQINIYGKSYWFNNGGNYSEKFPVPVSSILDAFLGNPTMIGKGITNAGISTPTLLGDLENFRTRTDNVDAPWAYINWIFFDEQFKYAGGGFERVGGNGVVKDHSLVNVPSLKAPKNGYVFVYCSNESQHNVYFDNLQVFHNRGPILEETHYYPFGLTMSGISSKAAGGVDNRYRFNRGTELNTSFGINLYETKFRGLDPQIGRFLHVDPLADMSLEYSPYVYGNNNPILLNDPTGLSSDSSKPTLLQTVIVTSKKGLENARNWFSGADVGYTGSGWGHGPRRFLAGATGLGNTASNLFELGLHSQFQSREVRFVGGLLNKIKAEPSMQAFKNKIIQIVKADKRFRAIGFINRGSEYIEFGGNRAPAPMSEQFKDPFNPDYAATWQVATNETTWALRHAAVTYSAIAKTDGSIIIDFNISDTFDLRPGQGHTDDYNMVTGIVGPVYHDFFGGNDQMKVTAHWQETVK